MDAIDIIRKKSIKPINDIKLIAPSTLISIHFEDKTCVTIKNDINLRIFLCIIQHMNFEYIYGDKSHCTPEPLHFYKCLGFGVGDAVKFYQHENVIFFILFS